MEMEIKLLKHKVQDLSQENVALREINVQFQLENFKLQQKIKKMENSQFDECLMNETVDEPGESLSAVSLNDSTFDPTAEYLEEDASNVSHQKSVDVRWRQPPDEIIKKSLKTTRKRLHEEAFDEENLLNDIEDNLSVKYEIADVYEEESPQADSDYILEKQNESDIDGLEVNDEIDPKEAAKAIYTLAAKRGILDKIKSLEGGKRKDSSYVNKILDLIFDRVTLASSSARGQKCQSKLHMAARPALDPKKLQLCRQAFLYRLKREGLSYAAREERFKNFNNFVNFKIQNARKLLKK